MFTMLNDCVNMVNDCLDQGKHNHVVRFKGWKNASNLNDHVD